MTASELEAHYGGRMIGMARRSVALILSQMTDGRDGGTGNRRFAPINSWPGNANFGKLRHQANQD